MISIEETPENFPHPFHHVQLQKEDDICEPGSRLSPDTESAITFAMDFSASRTLRNKFLLLLSYLVYGVLLQPPGHTKTEVV